MLGTLLHCPRRAEIHAEVLRRHGLPTSASAVRERLPMVWQDMACLTRDLRDRHTHFPGGERAFWHRSLARLCRYLDLAEPSRFASAELWNRFAHADAWSVFPDVPDALTTLRAAGLRLGVIGNWDHRLPRLLDELGLRFDAVIYSAACGVEKPHPRIFRSCLERLGVADPRRAIHIGDRMLEDVEGAEAIGMRALRVERVGERDLDLAHLLRPFLSC